MQATSRHVRDEGVAQLQFSVSQGLGFRANAQGMAMQSESSVRLTKQDLRASACSGPVPSRFLAAFHQGAGKMDRTQVGYGYGGLVPVLIPVSDIPSGAHVADQNASAALRWPTELSK